MQIELAKNKRWFYRLVSKNGQTLLTSEVYFSRWNAKRAALRTARRNKLFYTEAEQ